MLHFDRRFILSTGGDFDLRAVGTGEVGESSGLWDKGLEIHTRCNPEEGRSEPVEEGAGNQVVDVGERRSGQAVPEGVIWGGGGMGRAGRVKSIGGERVADRSGGFSGGERPGVGDK